VLFGYVLSRNFLGESVLGKGSHKPGGICLRHYTHNTLKMVSVRFFWAKNKFGDRCPKSSRGLHFLFCFLSISLPTETWKTGRYIKLQNLLITLNDVKASN